MKQSKQDAVTMVKFEHAGVRTGIALVLFCTLLNVAAQLLLKRASLQLIHGTVFDMLTNESIFFAYALYGASTLCLMIALRLGPLSSLYPLLSLTYAWVYVLSPLFFSSDSYGANKLTGVIVIIAGVFLIASKKHAD